MLGSTELEYCHPGGKCRWAAPRRDPPRGQARLAALAPLPAQGSGGRGSTTVHMGAACPRTCAPGGRLSKEPSSPPLRASLGSAHRGPGSGLHTELHTRQSSPVNPLCAWKLVRVILCVGPAWALWGVEQPLSS